MVASAHERIKLIEKKFHSKDMPDFNVGDTVQMKIKVLEADKVRLHPFEGTVISKTKRGLKSTFTVRKISFGEGVERVFPVHSPVIESLKVIAKGKVRRSKLYYLRRMVGKQTKVKQDTSQSTQPESPSSDTPVAQPASVAA